MHLCTVQHYLEKCDLVFLREHTETGNALRKVDHAADRRTESFTKVLQDARRLRWIKCANGNWIEWTRL